MEEHSRKIARWRSQAEELRRRQERGRILADRAYAHLGIGAYEEAERLRKDAEELLFVSDGCRRRRCQSCLGVIHGR